MSVGGRRRRAVVMALFVVVAALTACSSPPPPVVHRYTIPAGTRDLYLTSGAPVVFPDELRAHVGDSILIVNDDKVGWQVGPYFVAAHGRLRQRFLSPSDLTGTCKMAAAGEFRIRVLARKT